MKIILALFFLLALVASLAASAQSFPPLQPNIIRSSNWTCIGPQNRNLVRITINNRDSDAINFRQNCSGRLGRVEVRGVFQDCFKVNPPAPAPHDLLIGSGYCRATAPPGGSVHQDGIQAGGGRNFTIRNFVFDVGPQGGGGQFFIAGFNGGQPDRFLCIHCAFGPRAPNQIRTPSDPDSGVKNSLVCRSFSGRRTYLPASGDKGGNFSPAANDQRCTFSGLLAYAGS